MGEAGMEARYLTDDSGERVGVVLGAEEYRAVMEVYDRVAKASRAIGEAEGSSSESRLVFEAKISEAQKELADAARKLEMVHRDYPPR
jgi:hypothetical protein